MDEYNVQNLSGLKEMLQQHSTIAKCRLQDKAKRNTLENRIREGTHLLSTGAGIKQNEPAALHLTHSE